MLIFCMYHFSTYELDYNPDAKQEKTAMQDASNKSKKSAKTKNNKKNGKSRARLAKVRYYTGKYLISETTWSSRLFY